MVVKMVALGIFGRRCYLGDTWNRLDFFIVMAGWAAVPLALPLLLIFCSFASSIGSFRAGIFCERELKSWIPHGCVVSRDRMEAGALLLCCAIVSIRRETSSRCSASVSPRADVQRAGKRRFPTPLQWLFCISEHSGFCWFVLFSSFDVHQ